MSESEEYRNKHLPLFKKVNKICYDPETETRELICLLALVDVLAVNLTEVLQNRGAIK